MGRNVSIKNLAEVIAARAARPDVMKANLVDGKWRKARWSGRKIAWERKKTLMAGLKWEWDIPRKIVEKKIPFKGKKRDQVRLDRAERIRRAMKKMPKLIAEYRASRERKPRAVGLMAAIREPRTDMPVVQRR